MKRILTLVAACLTMISVLAAVPAPIQTVVDTYNHETARQEEDGVRFGKAFISGNDIIFPMYMDDQDLMDAGITLEAAIDMTGG